MKLKSLILYNFFFILLGNYLIKIFRNKAYLSLVFLDISYNYEINKIKEGIVFHYNLTNLIDTNLKTYSALKLKKLC